MNWVPPETLHVSKDREVCRGQVDTKVDEVNESGANSSPT